MISLDVLDLEEAADSRESLMKHRTHFDEAKMVGTFSPDVALEDSHCSCKGGEASQVIWKMVTSNANDLIPSYSDNIGMGFLSPTNDR